MKKYFLILLFLTSCISTKITELKYNEVFGSGYEHLEGKIFSIKCSSSDYNVETIKNKCLENISKFVYDKSYFYFSILKSDLNTNKDIIGFGNNGYSYVTTITENIINYTFIILKDSEISKHNNFYRVADYYNIIKNADNKQ